MAVRIQTAYWISGLAILDAHLREHDNGGCGHDLQFQKSLSVARHDKKPDPKNLYRARRAVQVLRILGLIALDDLPNADALTNGKARSVKTERA